jgi:hypothetical protein
LSVREASMPRKVASVSIVGVSGVSISVSGSDPGGAGSGALGLAASVSAR